MHTFFHAANIARKKSSVAISMIPSHLANDGNFDTCFVSSKEDPWWNLELGVNIRVSMVFILHRSFFYNLESSDIVVGQCVLSMSPIYVSLVRCYHRSVSCT